MCKFYSHTDKKQKKKETDKELKNDTLQNNEWMDEWMNIQTSLNQDTFT